MAPAMSTAVSAASYVTEAVAPDSIVVSLRSEPCGRERLGHRQRRCRSGSLVTAARIVDRLNREFVAPLFHASPGQLNLLPAGRTGGLDSATILVDNGPGGTDRRRQPRNRDSCAGHLHRQQ
jgi:hypothetical protein